MCRFNSGFFFHHELLTPYKWYWRVEPDVRFYCDLEYDPFVFMEDHGKIYGFTISMPEWEPTIPSLWSVVKEFISDHPEYVSPNNSMDFISDDAGDTYNMCHFWSNFEIADMDFWRGEAYTKFFNHLENTGGFYYEAILRFLIFCSCRLTVDRDGEMHLFIASPQPYLHARINCSSLKI
jgi:alpha 1,2-mannosyltransferase